MSIATRDVIDLLAGIEPGSSLHGVRARRAQARDNAQRSYVALFEPVDFRDFAGTDRYTIAAFVAGIHDDATAASFYLAKLGKTADQAERGKAVKAEIERARTEGPYGAFPVGPLSSEDKAGLIYQVEEENRRVLGGRLAAALEHAHLLVFRPRDASSAALQALLDAGWSNTAIVTFSQLVAFLSFQVRTVAGLRMLGTSLVRHASGAG